MKYEGYNYGGIDRDNERNESYNPVNFESQMRRGFIRKVYGIVFAQLLFTALACVIAMMNKDVSHFIKKNQELRIAVLIISIVLVLVLSCFNEIAKKFPLNYFLLALFTVCEAYLAAYACVMTRNPKVVIMAATMTCALVFALTVYACVSDTDFTLLGGVLFCLSIGLFVGSLFALLTTNRTIHILLSALAVVLFSVYLIYDTQLLLGRHTYSLNCDDYIIGAMMIYMDVVIIFIEMLNILR